MKIIVEDTTISGALSNGLVSVNRDVLMKLIKLVYDCEKTKNIIGMTELFYQWSKLRIFRWAISATVNIPVAFLPNSKAGADVTVAGNTLKCTKRCESIFFFLDKEMVSGIYKIVFVSESSSSSRFCGVAHKTVMQNMHENVDYFIDGSFRICSRGIYSGEEHVLNKDLFSGEGRVTVALELCLNGCGVGRRGERSRGGGGEGKGTLHMFVNGMQIPYSITKVPSNVHFFINMYSLKGDFVSEIQLFQKLFVPTANTHRV